TWGPVVARIFVNRLQSGPCEDCGRYPRPFERDGGALRAEGCDLVFAPDERELYPVPQAFRVSTPPGLGDVLEGAFRPGFFEGVATVVLKLTERSEEHTSELQSRENLVCRLLLEKKKKT